MLELFLYVMMQEKIPEFIKENFISVDKSALFFTEGLFDKSLFGEKLQFLWIIHTEAKNPVSCWIFFKNFIGRPCQFSKEKIEDTFLVGKKFYLFVVLSTSSSTFEEILSAVLSELQSTCPGENLHVIFSRQKKINSKSFFGCWAKTFLLLLRKLQAVLSEKLFALPEDFLEVKIFLFQIKFCFLNLQ